MSGNSNDRREGRISADPDTVRGWADESNAIPVRSTSGDVHVLPEDDTESAHERVDWDEFFAALDDHDRVLIYHGHDRTEPFEVVPRDEAITRSEVAREEVEEQLLEGETVTSEIRETTVVESVVVEEATVESELVDSEVIEQSLIDADLLHRECTGCEIIDDREVASEWFDAERYFESMDWVTPTGADGSKLDDAEADGRSGPIPEDARLGTPEEDALAEESFPYYAALDLEETWAVTWELEERFTVESRITHTDVSGSDTVETRDIDVEGLQRTIAEEDLLDVDLSPDEVLAQCDVETEFAEGDRAHTHFTRREVLEDEVIDRKRLRTEIAGGEVLEMETIRGETVDTEFTDDEDLAPTGEVGADADRQAQAGDSGAASVQLSDDDVGSTVVDARGDEVGTVTGVDEGGDVLYVDPHQSLAERIKAALDWGDMDKDDYPIPVGRIEHASSDRVQLKDQDELEV